MVRLSSCLFLSSTLITSSLSFHPATPVSSLAANLVIGAWTAIVVHVADPPKEIVLAVTIVFSRNFFLSSSVSLMYNAVLSRFWCNSSHAVGVKSQKVMRQMRSTVFFTASALSLRLSLFFGFALLWALATMCLLGLWSDWCCCCLCDWLLSFPVASCSAPPTAFVHDCIILTHCFYFYVIEMMFAKEVI